MKLETKILIGAAAIGATYLLYRQWKKNNSGDSEFTNAIGFNCLSTDFCHTCRQNGGTCKSGGYWDRNCVCTMPASKSNSSKTLINNKKWAQH